MSSITVRQMNIEDSALWNNYVTGHPDGNVYQRFFWGQAIQQTYGHTIYNLLALKESAGDITPTKETVVGVLPLVHIKHFLFGNRLFSLPYADLGGLIADNQEAEQELLNEALEIARQQDIPIVELRQSESLSDSLGVEQGNFSCFAQQVDKVRMLLELPDSSDQLMNSFKSKLRSQIRRPLKEGLTARSGGLELLDDFYLVFAENMRDLGSPVHAKNFIKNIISLAGDTARLFIVYQEKTPLACSLTLVNGTTLANPWASALRKFSRLSPNMLLYWVMLEYGCENGYKNFDFGRSTPGEGTYKFKKQWGAEEKKLNWTTYSTQPEKIESSTEQKSKFEIAMQLWKKLPVPVSKVIGPVLRKNIGL